jgi:hypothetical protein
MYYVEVTNPPYRMLTNNAFNYSYGTYQITFGGAIRPGTTFRELTTPDVWENSALAGVDWFKFTATAAKQYIHADLTGSLSSINVQVYDSTGAVVVSTDSSESYSSGTLLTVGNEYYVRVYAGSTGTYRIAFNSGIVPPETTPVPLAVNTWAPGSLVLRGQNWFKFTAAQATQFIHADLTGTLSGNLSVRVYDSTGTEVRGSRGTEATFSGRYQLESWPLTAGDEYFVQVLSFGGGTYQIAFSNGFIPPGTTPAPLAENTWAPGNLVSRGQNWFKFTAAQATQFIHIDFSGSLSGSVPVCVYDSTGTEVRGSRGLLGSFNSTYPSGSWPLTVGDEYFVQVLSFGGGGTYQIKFSALSAP